MTRIIVSPEAIDFTTAGRRDYLVKVEHTTIWAHHLIPVTWVEQVDDKVRLNLTKDAAKAAWREKH